MLGVLTLCLETSLRHAIHIGRRFRLPIRRFPALILELLTIRPSISISTSAKAGTWFQELRR
jgi:hypothetical protein